MQSSISNIKINKIQNEKVEIDLFRCSKCFHIPFIKLEHSNLIIECILGHKEKITLEDFLKKNSSNPYNYISCSICNFKKDYLNCFYCIKYQKFFCSNHKSSHKIHEIISVKKFDSICDIHYKNYVYFCFQCKKNFCRLCFNLHYKHKKINLNSILLTNKDIDHYENIIKKIQEKIHQLKNKIINKQKNEFKKIIQETHLKLILGKKLLKNYQIEVIQKNICYELIENVINYFKKINKNIEQIISDFFNKKFSKNQNLTIFEMTNIKTFNNYIGFVNGDCLILLNYNDFAFTCNDKTIKIYNGNNLENKLNIKLIDNEINCLTKLKDDKLAITSYEQVEIIQLLDKNTKYKVVQRKITHKDFIFKLIELNNGNLVTCSIDQTIKFWNEIYYNENIKSNALINNNNIINDNNDNNILLNSNKFNNCLKPIYENLITIQINEGIIKTIYQIKENEILGVNNDNETIVFYNIITFEKITSITKVNCLNSICLINEDIFAINSYDFGFYLIKISSHEIIKKISNNSTFTYLFKANNGTIFSGEYFFDSFGERYEIEQWEIINDNICDWIVISKKENAHCYYINSIIELDDGSLVTSSFDNTVKVWKYN